MNYAISGTTKGGYIVEFSRSWPTLTECPCCGKPIATLRKAFLIAENLTLLADPQNPVGSNQDYRDDAEKGLEQINTALAKANAHD